MKIFAGDYEILASGALSSTDLSDIRFVVSESPLLEVVCRINNKSEESGIDLETLGENTIALVFNKPRGLGYGTASPVKVGRLNGRILYVGFHVNTRGDNTSYDLNYTFYLGGEV